MRAEVDTSSRATLLAAVLASQAAGCGLFPDVTQFIGRQQTPDAAHDANVPCAFGAPRYLKAAAPVASAGFGSTLAMNDRTLVVVAPQERKDTPPIAESHDPSLACPARPQSPVPPSGAIRIYDRDGADWTAQPVSIAGAELVTGSTMGPQDRPAILSEHNFTLMSIAVKDDWLAVGLAGDNQPGLLRGSVRLFARMATAWREVTPMVEPDTENLSIFGYSVAISGSTLVVGAPGTPPVKGAAYVYDLTQSPPALVRRLQPDPLEENAVYGADVAVSEDWVIVGAPGEEGEGLYGGTKGVGAAYVYRRPDLEEYQRLAPMGSIQPQAFGTRFILERNLLLVAAPATDGCEGAARFAASGVINPFELRSGKWVELPCISVHDDHVGLFGWSLALSSDKLFVGAPFSWSGDPFGGTSGIGRSALEGTGAAAGRTYVFDRHGSTFVGSCFLESPNPDPCDNFGQGVALGGDVLAVGAFGEDGALGDTSTPDTDNGLMDSGAVYLYPLSEPLRDADARAR